MSETKKLLESFQKNYSNLDEETSIFNIGDIYKNPQGAIIQIDTPTKFGEPQFKIASNEEDFKNGKYEVRKTNSYDSLNNILTINKYKIIESDGVKTINENNKPNYDNVIDSSEVENMSNNDIVNLYCRISDDAGITVFDAIQELYVNGALNMTKFKETLINTLDYLNDNI